MCRKKSKYIFIKTVNKVCVKRCSNIYIYWVKKDLFGLFLEREEIRDKDNETGLKREEEE